MLQHLERQLIGLVMGWAPEDVHFRWEDWRGVFLRGAGNCISRRGVLGSAQVVDQLVHGLVNSMCFLACQVTTPLILFRIIKCRNQHVFVDFKQCLRLQEISTISVAPSWSRATSRW